MNMAIILVFSIQVRFYLDFVGFTFVHVLRWIEMEFSEVSPHSTHTYELMWIRLHTNKTWVVRSIRSSIHVNWNRLIEISWFSTIDWYERVQTT
jgi:hypothetical protein